MASSLRELVVSVTANTTRYQSEMQRAGRMATDFGRTVQQTAPQAVRAWDMQSAAVRSHATAMEASTQALGRYATAVAGALGVRELIGMADDWGQLNARIRQAAGAGEDFGEVQSRLEEIANRTFRRYSEAADQFAATARPMRELGFATRDTLDAAEALGLALVAGGSNAQRGAAAQDAWAKSVVQGKIATDQFQTLLLQTPRVVQALSDGLGKSTAELQQMATDGELLISRVLPALTSQMGTLREEVDRMPTTVQDATNRLLDGLQRWAGGTNEATGATGLLVRGLDLLTRHIDEVATLAISAGVGVLGSKMVMAGKGAVEAAQGFMQAHRAQVELTRARKADAEFAVVEAARDRERLVRQRDIYASMMATATSQKELEYATRRHTFVSEQAAAATAAHTAAQNNLTVANNAAAAATNRLAAAGRGLLALVGGPGGLALTIGTVAAGWLMFRDNTEQAQTSLADLTGTMDEAIVKFREMNRAQQAGALLSLSEQVDEASRKISDAISLMSSEADFTDLFDTFGAGLSRLQTEFNAGRISAEDFSNGVSQLAEQLAATGQIEEVQRRGLIRYAEAIANGASEVERKRSLLGLLTGENERLGASASNAAGALGAQAGALGNLGNVAEAVDKHLKALNSSIDSQIVNLVRLQEGAEKAFMVEVGQRINAAGGVDALTPEQRAEYNRQIEIGLSLIRRTEAAQEANTRATRIAASAEKEAAKAQRERIQAADEYLAGLNEAYASQVQGLEREIALYGQVGQAAQMAYDLANGALSELQQAQKDRLLQLAQERDALEANARAAAGYAALVQKYATPRERAQVEAKDDRASAWMALIGGEVDDAGYQELMDRIDAKARQTTDNMTIYAEQAGRNIQSYLGDSLYDILDGRFEDIGDSFANMLKRMAAELAASQVLNALGGALAGYGGTGTWGTLIRGIGGAMQTSGGRAGGGRVEAFKAYDITEHGQPEVLSYGGRNVLIMGAQGGMVSPLMNAKGGGTARGGGAAPKVEIHIENQSGTQLDTSQRNVRFDGERLFVNVVAKAIGGGQLDGAMRQRFGMAPRGVPTG